MPMFMPMSLQDLPPISGVAAVLCINLPAWWMFPDPTRGCWKDCYRDPDKVKLLNAFLWLLAAADHAAVNTYIETVPDYELMSKGVITVARFYRMFVPLTEAEARAIILHMAMALTEVADVPSGGGGGGGGRPTKKQRTAQAAEQQRLQDDTYKMSNTSLDYKRIDSEATLLQWYSTALAGAANSQFNVVDFGVPPDANWMDDGGLDSDPSDDGEVSTAFSDFMAGQSANHILKMFSISTHFKSGTGRFEETIHSDQLDMAKYWDNGVFQFPAVCAELGLVVKITYNAPFIGGDPNNLWRNFALPAATSLMSTEELFRKMESMNAISGTDLPAQYRSLPFTELRDIWFSASADSNGQQDPTYFSPIEMLDPVERRSVELNMSQSEETLSDMYPSQGQLSFGFSTEFNCLRRAVHDGTIDQADMDTWRTDAIRRIDQLFAGPRKDGFVGAYFRVASEAASLKQVFDTRQTDPTIKEATRLLHKQVDGLGAGGSLQCTFAELLRGPLHMTPAQAAVVLFVFNGTLTALLPEINCAQPTVCMFGPSDSGKSAAMELILGLILQSARVRRDTHSKLAMTSHSELGVQSTGELKTGVDSGGVHEATNWLTSWSTGLHVHERLKLATRPGEVTCNVISKADRRRFEVTATNHVPHPSFYSRLIPVYMSGVQLEGSRSRQELSTISDTTLEYMAAKKVFNYVWALHSDVHKVQQCIRFAYCKSYFPLWYSVTKDVLGKSYAPAPRQVSSVGRLAMGYMFSRLIAEYMQIPEGAQRPPSFVEYVMANPVITMQDYMTCYVQQDQNTDMEQETTMVVTALKESILRSSGVELKIEVHDADYYVTSVKTVPEVCARCQGGIENAQGIVRDVMRRLQSGDGKGAAPMLVVVNARSKDYVGHYALHKSLAADIALSSPTRAQSAILEFLGTEILTAATNGAHHHIGYDEQWVIFKSPVKDRLVNPGTCQSFRDSAVLRKYNLQENELTRAMLLMEAAGVIMFRDPDVFPPNLDAEGAILHSIQPPGSSAKVDRGGPVDGGALLEGYLETGDDEITPQWIEDKAADAGYTSLPVVRPWKTVIRITGVLQVRTEFLRQYIDNIARARVGGIERRAQPPGGSGRKAALGRLWDTVAAISGELKPGDKVCNGVSPRSLHPYEEYTIRELETSTVKVRNPRRHGTAMATDGVSSVDDFLLPPDKPMLLFQTDTAPPLTPSLQTMCARINCMPERWVRQ